jgi:hypothetical protein
LRKWLIFCVFASFAHFFRNLLRIFSRFYISVLLAQIFDLVSLVKLVET